MTISRTLCKKDILHFVRSAKIPPTLRELAAATGYSTAHCALCVEELLAKKLLHRPLRGRRNRNLAYGRKSK